MLIINGGHPSRDHENENKGLHVCLYIDKAAAIGCYLQMEWKLYLRVKDIR